MWLINAMLSLVAALFPVYLSVKFGTPVRLRNAAYKGPHKHLYGDTLGLPASYARFLYLTGLLSHTLLGLGAWQVLRHGGLMQNLNQYGIFLLLLAVAPFCRLHSSPSRRWKRNLLPDIAVLVSLHYLTMHVFHKSSRLAGLLVLPSLGWICSTVTLITLFARQQRKTNPEWLTGKDDQADAVPATTSRPAAQSGIRQSRKPNLTVLPLQPEMESEKTSPFANVPDVTAPLVEAKELLAKLTESLGHLKSPDRAAEAHLKAGLLRVQSLLLQVDAKTPGPLSRVSSLFKEAFSFTRPMSAEVDYFPDWPFSETIPVSYFDEPGVAGFKVRGEDYLQDKKKFLPEKPQTQLVSLNLLSVQEPTYHIARFLPSIKDSRAPFIFVWQIMVPGRTNISLTVAWALDHDPLDAIKEAMTNHLPEASVHCSPVLRAHRATDPQGASVSTIEMQNWPERKVGQSHSVEASHQSFTNFKPVNQHASYPPNHRRTQSTAPVIDMSVIHEPLSTQSSMVEASPSDSRVPALVGVKPFDISMARFLDETGDEASVIARRNSMFKIIPRIEKGSWLVRQAVGQTPVLLGKKLTTKYFRGPRYIEVDIDIGSSSAAAHVTGLVQGSLKSLVIDLAVVLEGRSQEELPESLLGTVRLNNLDLSKAGELDAITGTLTRKE